MTTTERSGRRAQLLAAVSVLGVSLGMAAPALARDPTAVEDPNGGVQTSQKGLQSSVKDQVSLKSPTTQVKTIDLQSSQKGLATQGTQNSQKGTSAWGGGVGDATPTTTPAP